MTIAFRASRYGRSLDGTDDYINCPFDREQYGAFIDALLAGQSVPAHIEADRTPYFEACLPIEELARRELGWVKPGDTAIVVIRDDTPTPAPATACSATSSAGGTSRSPGFPVAPRAARPARTPCPAEPSRRTLRRTRRPVARTTRRCTLTRCCLLSTVFCLLSHGITNRCRAKSHAPLAP